MHKSVLGWNFTWEVNGLNIVRAGIQYAMKV